MSDTYTGESFSVIHLSTAHSSSDIRIYRKECTALHEAGVSVAYMSRGPGPSGRVPWIELPQTRGRFGRMIRGPLAAWRRLRRLRPDVLHLHDPELIPLGLLWRRLTGGVVIYDAHEDLPKQVAGKTYLPRWSRRPIAFFAQLLEGAAERGMDVIVAATPSIAANYPRARRVELVQNFPWLRDYPDSTPVSDADPTTACYVGGISRGRGSDIMALAAHESGVTLTVAGRMDRDAHDDLSVLGSRLINRGVVDPSEVPSIIDSSAIGLVLLKPLPNYMESQPTKLFEYMAAGRPFIASDFPYWRDLVGEEACGLFVDSGNADDVAKALRHLSSDRALLQQMGARGRRSMEENFSFERQARILTGLVTELLATAR